LNSFDDFLFLKGSEVQEILAGREGLVLQSVREAYVLHAQGETSLPHSTFLRFPDDSRDRIIGLPAFLGGSYSVAGMKWIASVPGNIEHGIDRASAAMILNERKTGRPRAILEASLISGHRTAASAALAARELHGREPRSVTVVGCGLIGFLTVRYLRWVWPQLEKVYLWDLSKERADYFASRLDGLPGGLDSAQVRSLDEGLAASEVTVFATTAAVPHVRSLAPCQAGSTLLHVSLRDLEARLLLENDNVVDDLDHVCRAQTSVHLAAEEAGNTNFVRASLGEILIGAAAAKKDPRALTIFSPFGLGILDLAVASLVCKVAGETNVGLRIKDFFPEPWMSPAVTLERS
jgi:ornithine cyclodeaminase